MKERVRVPIMSASVVVAVVLFGSLSAWNSDDIEFADERLEAVIRQKAERPEGTLRRTDLLRITELDGGSRGIEDLGGIEQLRRLETLRLSNNRIEDVTALAELRRLVDLDLSSNGLDELAAASFDALAGSRLRSITLRNNGFSDLSPLAGLVNLVSLDLRDNNVRDLTPIVGLRTLESLNVRGNDLRDIEPVSELRHLRYLNLHSNRRAAGFSAVAELADLEEIIARGVPVGEDVTALEGLNRLRRANLRDTGIWRLPDVGRIVERADRSGAAADRLPWVDVRGNPALRQLDAGGFADLVASVRQAGAVLPEVVPPRFSVERGFHPEPFDLVLTAPEGSRVFYTLDGSQPDPETNPQRTIEYTDPITIDVRGSQGHVLQGVGLTYTGIPMTPADDLPAGSVVTARTFLEDATSESVSHTYFVGEDVFARYGIQVMSLTTDPEGLFGHDRGIMVAGRMYEETVGFWRDINPDARGHYQPANFHQRGRVRRALEGVTVIDRGEGLVAIPLVGHGVTINFRYLRSSPQITLTGTAFYDGIHFLDPSSSADELVIQAPYVPVTLGPEAELAADWERPVSAELFDAEGDPALLQDLGLRIHGAASRTGGQKSLRLYSRGSYGTRDIRGSIFAEDDGPHRRLLLRRTTERSGLDDALGQALMRRLEPEADIQRYAPVALFLNGDFFGSYSIRDRYDQWFLSGSYSIDPDDLVFAGRRIGRSGFTLHGDEAIAEEFLEVERFIRSEDLSSPEALAYVERHLDLENYMSYMITGIFLNYTDWGTGKHRRVWRSTGDLSETHPSLDGRWRWLPLDLDGTFVRGGPVDQNHLRDIIESRRYLLTFLLENEAFEERFRQRFEEALGTELHPERTALLLEDYVAHISPGLRSDHDRLYGIASDAWDGHVEGLREFLTQRPDEVRRHLEEFFG